MFLICFASLVAVAPCASGSDPEAPSGGDREHAIRDEVARAYHLSHISAAAEACLRSFRLRHSDAAEAWSVLRDGGDEVEETFRKCSQETGVSIASLRDFMESADGARGFSRTDFELAWNHSCPAGFYRSSPIVFPCHATSGRAHFFMRGGGWQEVATIPSGIANALVGIMVNESFDLILRDDDERVWVVREKSGAAVAAPPLAAYREAALGFDADARRPPLLQLSMKVDGILPVRLHLLVNNSAHADTVATVVYSWDNITHCPEVPEGCSSFDEARAHSCVESFSDWLSYAYASHSMALKVKQLFPYAAGVPFHKWQELWELWPQRHECNSTWQELFHYADNDGNGVVEQREFSRILRTPSTEGFIDHLFTELHARYPASQDAWHAAAGNASEVSPPRWESIVADAAQRGQLPGGARICDPAPATKPFIFEHVEPLKISHTSSKTLRVGPAERQGIVGGGFTVLARLWRSRAREAVQSGVPQVNTENNLVFSTPAASKKDFHEGRALFLGVRGGKLAMSFGPQGCHTDEDVPMEEWVMAAWVYNRSSRAQRLYLEGRTQKVCEDAEPFKGFGQEVWIGEGHGHSGTWHGELSSLYIFPEELTDEDVSAVFQRAPTWAQMEQVNFHGEGEGAIRMGTAKDLGFDGGSFTAMVLLKLSVSDGDLERGTFNIIGTPEDNSLQMMVRHGSLSLRFPGHPRCSSELPFPRDKWVHAAFVYNAWEREQLIYQDGQVATVCKDVPPYHGGSKAVWLGQTTPAAEGGISSGWHGAMKELQVLNRSECSERVAETFKQIGTSGPHVEDSQDSQYTLAADSFESLDGDRDGSISRGEFVEHLDVTERSTPPKTSSPTPSPRSSSPTASVTGGPAGPRSHSASSSTLASQSFPESSSTMASPAYSGTLRGPSHPARSTSLSARVHEGTLRGTSTTVPSASPGHSTPLGTSTRVVGLAPTTSAGPAAASSKVTQVLTTTSSRGTGLASQVSTSARVLTTAPVRGSAPDSRGSTATTIAPAMGTALTSQGSAPAQVPTTTPSRGTVPASKGSTTAEVLTSTPLHGTAPASRGSTSTVAPVPASQGSTVTGAPLQGNAPESRGSTSTVAPVPPASRGSTVTGAPLQGTAPASRGSTATVAPVPASQGSTVTRAPLQGTAPASRGSTVTSAPSQGPAPASRGSTSTVAPVPASQGSTVTGAPLQENAPASQGSASTVAPLPASQGSTVTGAPLQGNAPASRGSNSTVAPLPASQGSTVTGAPLQGNAPGSRGSNSTVAPVPASQGPTVTGAPLQEGTAPASQGSTATIAPLRGTLAPSGGSTTAMESLLETTRNVPFRTQRPTDEEDDAGKVSGALTATDFREVGTPPSPQVQKTTSDDETSPTTTRSSTTTLLVLRLPPAPSPLGGGGVAPPPTVDAPAAVVPSAAPNLQRPNRPTTNTSSTSVLILWEPLR